jgi:hypothetical protein
MLRCVPDGSRVGQLLADAWARATGGEALPVEAGGAPGSRESSAGPQPCGAPQAASVGVARSAAEPLPGRRAALAGR